MITKNQSIIRNAILLEFQKLCDSINTEDIKHTISIKKMVRDLLEEKVIDMNEAYDLEVYLFGLKNLINNKR